MITRCAIASIALLALTGTARADKFHFGTADAKLQGNASDSLRGVLVKENKDTYVIRVVGGTIEVAKSTVRKIDRDGLTVADIEREEKAKADTVAKADKQRRDVQAAEASARRDRAEEPAKTERALVVEIDFQGLLPGYKFKTGFDPVIGRMNLAGLRQVIETYLKKEALKGAYRGK